jgi:hypothetical protein
MGAWVDKLGGTTQFLKDLRLTGILSEKQLGQLITGEAVPGQKLGQHLIGHFPQRVGLGARGSFAKRLEQAKTEPNAEIIDVTPPVPDLSALVRFWCAVGNIGIKDWEKIIGCKAVDVPYTLSRSGGVSADRVEMVVAAFHRCVSGFTEQHAEEIFRASHTVLRNPRAAQNFGEAMQSWREVSGMAVSEFLRVLATKEGREKPYPTSFLSKTYKHLVPSDQQLHCFADILQERLGERKDVFYHFSDEDRRQLYRLGIRRTPPPKCYTSTLDMITTPASQLAGGEITAHPYPSLQHLNRNSVVTTPTTMGKGVSETGNRLVVPGR